MEDVEAVLDAVVDRLSSYLESASSPGDPITEAATYEQIRRTKDVKLPRVGHGIEALLEDVDTVLQSSVRTHAPGFMNPLWGGISLPSLVGEILTAATNTSMATYELSPFATLVERVVLERMSEFLGFGVGTGVLTTGGSNGNLMGLICARAHASPLSLVEGSDGRQLTAFISEEAHYSCATAMTIMGIARSNLIKVRTDGQGRMRPDALEEAIEASRRQGEHPFCIVATSGTTVLGAFDPLRAIAEVANRAGIWMHVDAAWGGAALLSTRTRSLMDGIENADSVCWDAHKMMSIPLICSAFILKDERLLRQIINNGRDAHYLLLDEASGLDLGRLSLACGRRNDALKLWMEWRAIGDVGWSDRVDGYMALADHLQQLVEASTSLEMAAERSWTNVCFRMVADRPEEADARTEEVRRRLLAEGAWMVSRSLVDGRPVLRSVITNPAVSRQSLEAFISEIERIHHDVIRGIPPLPVGTSET